MNQSQSDFPSRIEISYLLDSGAYIFVINYPTYFTIATLPNIKLTNKLNSSKTLTVANQIEVAIFHFVTITSKTTIEDDSRQFIIPLAVADTKYNILGTLFFEEYKQNINIQHFTLQFKHSSPVHLKFTKVTSLLSKDLISYIYSINILKHNHI